MKRILLLATLLFTAMLAACGSTTDPKPQANLRILHASPDAGAVDVLLDDKRILVGFPFKEAIGFNRVDAGNRNIKVNATGSTTPLIDDSRNLAEGSYYTAIVANKLSGIKPIFFEEDKSAVPAGKLRLRVVHAAPAAPSVDIYVNLIADDFASASVTPAVRAAAFETVSPPLDVTPGDYVIRVTLAGTKTEVFNSGKQPFGEGVNLTFVAVEQNVGLSPISLVSLTRNFAAPRGELFDISAQARVIHASPDAPAIDFLIGDVIKQTAVAYGGSSAYFPTVSPTANIKINSAGTSTNLITTDAAITASTSYSVYVMGFAAAPAAVVIADFLSPPTTGNAKLRFVHASPDTVALDVFQDDSTTSSLAGLLYKSGSGYLSVPVGSHVYKINLTGTTTAALPTQTLVLEAGKVYSAVVFGSSVAGAAKPLELKLITDR